MKYSTRVAAASLAAAVTMLPAPAVAQGRAVARPAPAARAVTVARPAPYYRPYSYYRPYPYYPYYGGYYPYYGSSLWFGFGYPGAYYPYWSYPAGYCCGYSGSSLHIQVTPRAAEVFVDGYYAGKVDDFDGTFQRLRLEPGHHTVQLYAAGHRTVEQDLYLQPGNTTNIKTTLQPLAPGEPEPVRPAAPPVSQDLERGTSISVAPPRPLPGTVPGELGTLAIRVRPGDAMVTIDGERWDSSADADRLTVTLPPGLHHVEIVKDGYRSYSADVTLRPGQTESLNVSLAR
jgi:PEGA domain-containing protein